MLLVILATTLWVLTVAATNDITGTFPTAIALNSPLEFNWTNRAGVIVRLGACLYGSTSLFVDYLPSPCSRSERGGPNGGQASCHGFANNGSASLTSTSVAGGSFPSPGATYQVQLVWSPSSTWAASAATSALFMTQWGPAFSVLEASPSATSSGTASTSNSSPGSVPATSSIMTTPAPSSTTVTTSTTQSGADAVPSATTAAASSDSSGSLSTGAKAGLGVGVSIAGILLIVGAYFCLRWCQRRKQVGANRNVPHLTTANLPQGQVPSGYPYSYYGDKVPNSANVSDYGPENIYGNNYGDRGMVATDYWGYHQNSQGQMIAYPTAYPAAYPYQNQVPYPSQDGIVAQPQWDGQHQGSNWDVSAQQPHAMTTDHVYTTAGHQHVPVQEPTMQPATVQRGVSQPAAPQVALQQVAAHPATFHPPPDPQADPAANDAVGDGHTEAADSDTYNHSNDTFAQLTPGESVGPLTQLKPRPQASYFHHPDGEASQPQRETTMRTQKPLPPIQTQHQSEYLPSPHQRTFYEHEDDPGFYQQAQDGGPLPQVQDGGHYYRVREQDYHRTPLDETYQARYQTAQGEEHHPSQYQRRSYQAQIEHAAPDHASDAAEGTLGHEETVAEQPDRAGPSHQTSATTVLLRPSQSQSQPQPQPQPTLTLTPAAEDEPQQQTSYFESPSETTSPVEPARQTFFRERSSGASITPTPRTFAEWAMAYETGGAQGGEDEITRLEEEERRLDEAIAEGERLRRLREERDAVRQRLSKARARGGGAGNTTGAGVGGAGES